MQRRFLSQFALSLALGSAFLAAPGFVLNGAPVAVAEPQVSGSAVDAAKAAFAGDFAKAGQLAERSGDPAAAKLVELIYLRDRPNEAGYNRIVKFLDEAPNWPLAESLQKRAERTLYVNRESADTILAHFESRKPLTAEGSLALARAHRANGNDAVVKKLVQTVWSNAEIDAKLEKEVGAEFKDYLSSADHERRMWQMFYAEETVAGVRMSGRLSANLQKAAKVAQALVRGTGGADKQYNNLPSAMRNLRRACAMRWRAIIARIPTSAKPPPFSPRCRAMAWRWATPNRGGSNGASWQGGRSGQATRTAVRWLTKLPGTMA